MTVAKKLYLTQISHIMTHTHPFKGWSAAPLMVWSERLIEYIINYFMLFCFDEIVTRPQSMDQWIYLYHTYFTLSLAQQILELQQLVNWVSTSCFDIKSVDLSNVLVFTPLYDSDFQSNHYYGTSLKLTFKRNFLYNKMLIYL